MMRPALRSLALALAVLATSLLGSCSGAPPAVDRYYHLSLAAAPAAAPATSGVEVPTLTLMPFETRGVYSERALLYRHAQEVSIQQYRQAFWAESPATLLSDSLGDELRQRFGDQRVFSASDRVRTEWVVRPRVRALEAILVDGGMQARLGLEFVVGSQRETLFLLRFEESAPVAGGTLENYVRVTSELFTQASDRLAERIQSQALSPAGSAD